jgi:cell division protease FtsH
VDESYDTAEDVLIRNRILLDKLSKELIEYETVDARHLVQLIEEYAVDKVGVEKLLHGHSRNGHPDGHRE